MKQELTLYWLSALVFVPAFGAGAVIFVRRHFPTFSDLTGVIFSGATFTIALLYAVNPLQLISEPISWIPFLGVSYVVGIEPLSGILIVWTALFCLLAVCFYFGRSSRQIVFVLALESAAIGIFVARDAFLFYSFFGLIWVLSNLLLGSQRKYLRFQGVGFSLLLVFFSCVYQMVYDQTGFLSTSFTRWQAIVLFPQEEIELLSLAMAGIVFLIVGFAAAMQKANIESVVVLLGSQSVVGIYFLHRLVFPLLTTNSAFVAPWIYSGAVALIVYASLGSGWFRVALGFHGVVLTGLFSYREHIVIGAEMTLVVIVVGLTGIILTNLRLLRLFHVLFLIGMTSALVLVPLKEVSLWWFGLIGISMAGLSFRLVLQAELLKVKSVRSQFVLAIPIVLFSLLMLFGNNYWKNELRSVDRGLRFISLTGETRR